MAIDLTNSPIPTPAAPAVVAQTTQQVTQQTTQQTTLAVETPAQAVQAGLARYPLAALGFAAAIVAVLLTTFAYLVVAAVSADSGIAQHYLAAIFSADAVWVALAAIVGVGAYLAPSPVAAVRK